MVRKGRAIRITKVSKEYQTRIPVEVAKILGVQVGDGVLWRLEDDRVIVEKA